MCTYMTRDGAKTWWGVDLPREIAYLYKNYPWEKWVRVTYKEIFAKKKQRQDSNLSMKRRADRVVPCYIWVFRNMQDFPYGGWWVYIRTVKEDYAVNFRNYDQVRLMDKIRSLFPCGILNIEGSFTKWAESFEKQYHRKGKRKKNAVVACHCKINQSGYLADIIL